MNKTNLIVGARYGKVTVLGTAKTRNWQSYSLVKCDCGIKFEAPNKNIKSGNTKTCGCSRDIAHNAILDMVGKKFGRLTVVKRTTSKDNRTRWYCQCDCGRTTLATGKALRTGKKQSCGCIKREKMTLPEGEAARNHLFLLYKAGADRRGLSFNLTIDDFVKLTSENCHYCGKIPSSWHKPITAKTGFIYNGVDRTNSNIGYELSNCVPCCTTCNKMKMALDYNNFINQCSIIANNFKKLAETTNSALTQE